MTKTFSIRHGTRRTSVRAALLGGVMLSAALLIAGAPSGDGSAVTTYGTEVRMGNGKARSYVVSAGDGTVLEVGVALTEAALSGLPADGGHHHGHHDGTSSVGPDGHVTHEHVLRFPEGASIPFRHVVVNWNPGGHEPPGMYDVEHFDFHFYTIPLEERLAMHPDTDPDFGTRAGRLPPDELVPPGYVMPEFLPFPRMGLHWVDPTSPEIAGTAPFTRTFIFGSWDGRIHFWEPMVTKATLEERADFSAAVPRPARASEAGVYPGAYSIRWDDSAREWRIALTDFRFVPAP